jgi:hypothetical protein
MATTSADPRQGPKHPDLVRRDHLDCPVDSVFGGRNADGMDLVELVLRRKLIQLSSRYYNSMFFRRQSKARCHGHGAERQS